MMARLRRIGFLSLAATLALTSRNWAQEADGQGELRITVQDYARAEQWLRQNIGPKVKNLFVTPHWIGDTDEFWYQRQTADGWDFLVVDASSGEKKPAFDHGALAQALTSASRESVAAAELPFRSFSYKDDRSAITFTVYGTEYRCELRPARCKGSEPVSSVEGVLVSPDGRRGILSRGGNIWLRDMAAGDEKPLTHDGEDHFGYGIYYGNWKAAYIPRERAGRRLPPMAAEWDPDSRKVLVTRLDERHVAEYPLLETAPADGTFRPKVHLPRIPLTGEEPAKLDWFVLDVETNRKVRLNLPYDELLHVHQDMLALRRVWWSSDTSHLFALAFGDNMESAYLFDIDLGSGEPRTVVEEHMSPRTDLNSTSYNPPNVRILGNGEEVIWFSQRDGWGHLYLYDGRTGKLKNQITKGEWLVRDIIEVDEENRRIFFTAAGREHGDPYYRYLYRVKFDGSDLTLLSPEHADHLLTGQGNDVLTLDGASGYEVVSPRGNFVVYNYSRVDQPTKTVIRLVEDGSLVSTVEEADASALYAAGWQDPQAFVVRAADGVTDLYGVMYTPRGFDPNKKYPVIDSQYASPLTAVVPHNFTQAIMGVPALLHPASLTELGFVAVVVDARGTTYRSREFSHYSDRNLNTIGLEDHVAAIRELGQRQPWMDLDRVGIHGASYGGFTAFRAMFEFPDFFKVGISSAGMGAIHNMYPDYHWTAFHGRARYSDGTSRRPTPTDKPENYLNNDGTIQAANLKGKLLIMLGELDENVLPGTTLQVVDALIKMDKDFDMLYVPNRPHQIGSAHVVRRAWNYFVQHLHGVEPPRDFRLKPFN